MMKKIIFNMMNNIMKKVVFVKKKLIYVMLIVIICLFFIICLFLIIIYLLFIVYTDDPEINNFDIDFFISEFKKLFKDPNLLWKKITLFSSSSPTDLTIPGSDLGRPLVARPLNLTAEIPQNNTPEIPQNNVPESSLTRFEGIRSRKEFSWLRRYLTDRFMTENIGGFNVNDANVLQGKENAEFWTRSRANDIMKVDRLLNQSGINVTASMPDSLDNSRVIETYRMKYYVILDKNYSNNNFSLLEKSLKDFHVKEELFNNNYDIGVKQVAARGSDRALLSKNLTDNAKLGIELSKLIGKSPISNPHSINYLINK